MQPLGTNRVFFCATGAGIRDADFGPRNVFSELKNVARVVPGGGGNEARFFNVKRRRFRPLSRVVIGHTFHAYLCRFCLPYVSRLKIRWAIGYRLASSPPD